MSGTRSGGGRRILRMAAGQILALGLVALATLVRAWVGDHYPDALPLSLYYPAILAAALLAGGWAGVTAVAASTAVAWTVFLPSQPAMRPAFFVDLGLFLASGAFMVFAGARLRVLIERFRTSSARFAERELRYRTLFEAVSEGFALVRAIRDSTGALTDYEVLEANPAMLRILGYEASPIGRRASEILTGVPAGWLAACDRALGGEPLTFEYQTPEPARWLEIHLSRVGPDLLAQFVHDISDRKIAEAHQSEMFDELNHRVKNNLALVSAMLNLQGRDAAPEVRAHLAKAVDRIQAIAEVHASLYRTSRKDDVDFAAYLVDLCERLAGSLLEEGERVRLRVTAEPAVMPLERAVSLGVIVNELVTNAAKHAYPPPAAGVIGVDLTEGAEGLVLSVSDSGGGLSGDLPGAGIGMRLVRSLVQQIGATLDVEHGAGTTFRIRLPAAAGGGAGATRQSRLF